MKILMIFVMAWPSLGLAAIYGADQRKDIAFVTPQWRQAADAVAVALPSLYLKELDKNHYFHIEHDQRKYGPTVGLCKNERFSQQKSFGHCSAFLIHPKYLVTAGHCFLPSGEVKNQVHSYCENFSFWLGYNNQKTKISFLGQKIAKQDVVHCKKVVYAINNEKIHPQDQPRDFAILELTEPVTHIKPLLLASTKMRTGDSVVTIGHPHGLPAKYSGMAQTIAEHPTSWLANLDTLSGNSGGPVFNKNAEVVGILIAGHQHDTFYDSKNSCDRINTCDNFAKNCDEPTDLPPSNVILKSEVWSPWIEMALPLSAASL